MPLKLLKIVLLWITSAVYFSNCTDCPQELDLVFVVDSSGSIGLNNWDILTNFLVQVIERFEIGHDAVQVAVVRFASSVSVQWDLTSKYTSSKSRLISSLKSINYTKGGTDTPIALKVATEQIFGQVGDREEVPNLAIVVTDGKSNRHVDQLDDYATSLHSISRVISIGVTNQIEFNELLTIASSPCDVYTVNAFNEMDDDMDSTMDLICGCMPGLYRNESTCKCKSCPLQTYQPGWSEPECLDCEDGYGTIEGGSVTCTEHCDYGHYYNITYSMCVPCPKDSYSSDTGAFSCMLCPDGTITSHTGSIDADNCYVPQSPQTAERSSSNTAGLIAGVVCALLVLLGLGILIVLFLLLRKRKGKDAGGSIFSAPTKGGKKELIQNSYKIPGPQKKENDYEDPDNLMGKKCSATHISTTEPETGEQLYLDISEINVNGQFANPSYENIEPTSGWKSKLGNPLYANVP